MANNDLHFVRAEIVGQDKPPRTTHGLVHWLRTNMFATPGDTAIPCNTCIEMRDGNSRGRDQQVDFQGCWRLLRCVWQQSPIAGSALSKHLRSTKALVAGAVFPSYVNLLAWGRSRRPSRIGRLDCRVAVPGPPGPPARIASPKPSSTNFLNSAKA